ncbi:uncharacterized protein CTRU02_214256 [Colletotrichum truncatum]|uniref:Uncharacterized protein n=1 Tax=Colletotrichum truncatum TaxID=5467 RepID=A0ACC3YIJ8_COLTU|nr:uncharacterized protein CTRU02_11329 [Colletotrichum truncatum]KAF6786071.1 hypothetical protein CTRU02_11329 [Colletotrichum truncatum]
MRFSSLVLSAATASAAVITRQSNSPATKSKVLLGSPGFVSVADFDGKEFKVVANTSALGAPSWLAFKEPNLIYAVNENANDTSLFSFDSATNELKLVTNATGYGGVVSIEFNADKTRLVGTSFTDGTIDVWDTSSATELKLIKQLKSNDPVGPNTERQGTNHAHQAILDPSGRFFAVNDLGSDTVVIIDSKDDLFEITSHNRVPTPGCGPRHGVWYPAKAEKATHYLLVCEMLNLVQVFSVSYNDTGVAFTRTQELSTYGPNPPADGKGAAAEIAVTGDGKHVYVSNRLTGQDTDSIAHFKVKQTAATGGSPCSAAPGGIELEFVDSISSGGLFPRHFSLSKDEKTLLVGNQNGTSGLAAFSRAADSGKLTATAVASLPVTAFGVQGGALGAAPGPQFVLQIV